MALKWGTRVSVVYRKRDESKGGRKGSARAVNKYGRKIALDPTIDPIFSAYGQEIFISG